MVVTAPKRYRVEPDVARRSKNVSIKYKIRTINENKLLEICAKSFQSITGTYLFKSNFII